MGHERWKHCVEFLPLLTHRAEIRPDAAITSAIIFFLSKPSHTFHGECTTLVIIRGCPGVCVSVCVSINRARARNKPNVIRTAARVTQAF